MRSFLRPLVVACLPVLIAVFLLGLLATRWDLRVRASRVSLAEIAARYPVGSPQRAMALRREIMRRRHPRWTDLTISEIAARLETIASRALIRPHDSSSQAATPAIAPFLGDYTTVSAPVGEGFLLLRQSDCSLTYDTGTYSHSLSNPGYTIGASVPHYEQTLHQLAGMPTTGDTFPSGCTPINGSQTRAMFLGKTSQNLYVFASDGYDPSTQNNALYYGTIDSSYNYHSLSVDDSNPNVQSLTAGDLNKDGNGDIIELSYGNCTINVLLGNADGTFQSPVQYACSGYGSQGAVVADFNGDGNPDVAVISSDGYITIFLGAGDGTLHAGQSLQVSGTSAADGANLIAADTRGNGRMDIISSTGAVLLSNGDGTFTAGTQIPLSSNTATSSFGPNLAAADLNKDGKVDVVYDDGYSIDIYLGNGDGTFTPGPRYATIDSVGYVTITDIDGDGNLDIYTGMTGGQFFSGDQFDMNESYVLLGNGDGTFQGAPVAPIAYNGTNLADVNGDGRPDIVGEAPAADNNSVNFTTYLGRKDGSFSPTGIVLNVATITVSNVTQGATTYSNPGVNSYAIADVNGDGRADLVFVTAALTSYNARDILCVALGNTDGSFAQPSCLELPSLLSNPSTLPSGEPDFDTGLVANGIQVRDLNGDGKPDIFYSYLDNDYGAGTTTQGFVIQPGNGDGTFGSPKVLQLYSGAGASTSQLPQFSLFADVNNDGRPDLITTVVSNYPNYITTVYLNLNNGDGSFAASSTLPLSVNGEDPIILAADMNGDGKIDLISEGDDSSGNSNLFLYFGNGDGTFAAAKATAIFDGDDTNGMAVGDFNGDGKLDVAVFNWTDSLSGIYLGNGDGTLQTSQDAYGDILPAESIPLNTYGSDIAYDFDGDGKLDILAGDVYFHAITAPSVTTVGTTASTTSLSASSTSVTTGQSVTLTATVSGPTGTTAIPTGTVTFLDGTTSLGTGTLDSTGKATLSTSSLAVGTHSITAGYGGDSTFAASTSSAITLSVTAPAPSFALSLSPSSGTLASAGGTLTTVVSVTPSNGFSSATSLACSGLPAHTTCSFSPGTVTPGATPATSALTITTAVASAQLDPPQLPVPSGPGSFGSPRSGPARVTLASVGLCAAILLFGRRRRWLLNRALPALLLAGALWLTACNGSSTSSSTHTPIGPDSLTITATAGAVSQSTTFSLTVQ